MISYNYFLKGRKKCNYSESTIRKRPDIHSGKNYNLEGGIFS